MDKWDLVRVVIGSVFLGFLLACGAFWLAELKPRRKHETTSDAEEFAA